MTKLADKLREHGVYNTWDVLKRFAEPGKDVACRFTRCQPREVLPDRTAVFSPSHSTEPDAPWYQHGQEWFSGRMSESMPEAIAWASEKYGVDGWSTSPFSRSERIPTAVLDAARKFVKENP